MALYRNAFPAGYRDAFKAADCVLDIDACEALNGSSVISLRTCHGKEPGELLRVRLFKKDAPLPLSGVLPILEKMGVRVETEFPFLISRADKQKIWLSDFAVVLDDDLDADLGDIEQFKAALYRSWSGAVTNDSMNKLVIKAGLSWQKVRILRAYAAFFKQIKFEISLDYVARILVKRHKLAVLFVDLFHARFDPAFEGDRSAAESELKERISEEMEFIQTLDEDRVCRQYLQTILATLRTNFFQLSADGEAKPSIALKIQSSLVPGMIEPAPAVEAFVYSSLFEGVHLRFSYVARGGLRWSSRQEDYRTEVLGLVRAQQVKNSVIVPRGAKGGFILKSDMTSMTREQQIEEARRCYALFMNGLLDLADNIDETCVIYDANTLRYDEDDTYLVVAADKGTATFSDLANSVANERGFWLGDAFASGGSYGYDHKKMGITAKGAWISAARHFKELGHSLETEDISVVGIGDMSGDVFGNGMLLSKHLLLKAAFNHLHIFIDPNPDTSISFKERQRLFTTPGSGWNDYKQELISKGGGVFERAAKSISLSSEMQEFLGTSLNAMVPNELIKHILRAPVDMLWNGGIGTYVKSSAETNLSVGDPLNDALRVNGSELQARVVCEGGNLGLTQLGRVEFEQAVSGLVCTDFIDNSAGVNCSDLEVIIKMLLNAFVSKGKLGFDQRNTLLMEMTDEVSSLVLANNHSQTNALYYTKHYSLKNSEIHAGLMQELMQENDFRPEQENLPKPHVLRERARAGVPLTMPDLCTLFSHTKLYLRGLIEAFDLTSEPDLFSYLYDSFPADLLERYPKEVKLHNLANEIMATKIINNLTADMGMLFVHLMQREFQVSILAIVKAYVAVMRIFKLRPVLDDIDTLGMDITPEVRHSMRGQVMDLARRSVRWILRQYQDDFCIKDVVESFSAVASEVPRLLGLLPINQELLERQAPTASWVEGGVDADFVRQVASLGCSYHSFNIAYGSTTFDVEMGRFSRAYFLIFAHLDLGLFREKIDCIEKDNDWSILASYAFKQDLDALQRNLAQSVIAVSSMDSIEGKLADWEGRHATLLERWYSLLDDMKKSKVVDSAIVVMGIRILQKLLETT